MVVPHHTPFPHLQVNTPESTYQATFDTVDGQWCDAIIPWHNFVPVKRAQSDPDGEWDLRLSPMGVAEWGVGLSPMGAQGEGCSGGERAERHGGGASWESASMGVYDP